MERLEKKFSARKLAGHHAGNIGKNIGTVNNKLRVTM
jgi:hypothetical protein